MQKNEIGKLMRVLILATVMAAASTCIAGTTDAGAPAKVASPRLVDLGAGKCIPCKLMAPILEQLRSEYAGRFDVTFIDVWAAPEAANPYHIRVIPTQVFFDAKGKELFRHEGFYSREQILGKWRELGFAFAEVRPAR
jgi:thioredoxin 1